MFKDKEKKLTPILNELHEIFLNKFTNLQGNFIQNYLQHGNKTTIIIIRNGQTYKEIINRLNVQHTILSIRSYDLHNNGSFYFQITILQTKKIIKQAELGQVHKNGRLVDLIDTHNLTCKQTHSNTYSHDPVTEIHYTKCLFNYINNKAEIPIRNTNSTHEHIT
ncbi:unnamed protein product [Macrosiphum euphorbiae]|uniref:Uncharacterized protein n=1 Tax=Macrosiphum euphorbiae TaxID=13131 RepID=A0AAV0Y239_9HEMI|nr:unnamed protein product [Macrosiphum euphorbiae]